MKLFVAFKMTACLVFLFTGADIVNGQLCTGSLGDPVVNIYWHIASLVTYPEAEVRVFSRDGGVVYYSNGYDAPGNGKRNGKDLPAGTYYYVIDLKNDLPLLTGWVFLVR